MVDKAEQHEQIEISADIPRAHLFSTLFRGGILIVGGIVLLLMFRGSGYISLLPLALIVGGILVIKKDHKTKL